MLPPLTSAARKTVILPAWRDLIIRKNHAVHGSTFLGLPNDYRLKVPPVGVTIFDCPPGHIVVYAKQFDFGLRFPLLLLSLIFSLLMIPCYSLRFSLTPVSGCLWFWTSSIAYQVSW